MNSTANILIKVFVSFSALLVGTTHFAFGQHNVIKLEDVQVFEFLKRGVPDSLIICGGEWFVNGIANNLNELDNYEMQVIKRKVAERGCTIVYVDVRKVYTPRKGQLYILGLKRKQE